MSYDDDLAAAVASQSVALVEANLRADSAEAELRETAGELEKARERCSGQERLTARAVVEATVAEKRLTEATALLERMLDHKSLLSWPPRWRENVQAFLSSRAPAQPAMCRFDVGGMPCGEPEPCAEHPAQPAAPEPECAHCSRPAVCLGSYEDNVSWAYACGECCGHGNEDGRCFPLADVPERYLALVKRLAQLEDEQPAAPVPDCKCAALGAVVLCDACYRSRQPAAPTPVPMHLECPKCGTVHIDTWDDAGIDWSRRPHKTHLCLHCGALWKPAEFPTVGVPSAPEPSAVMVDSSEPVERQYWKLRNATEAHAKAYAARAESAEAQLAAVRLELRTEADAAEIIREICGIVFSRTPAPSPGAGGGK